MLKKLLELAASNEHENLRKNAESALTNRHCIAHYSRPSMGRVCEMSPRTRDDSERHQIKNSNKCSLYGDTCL